MSLKNLFKDMRRPKRIIFLTTILVAIVLAASFSITAAVGGMSMNAVNASLSPTPETILTVEKTGDLFPHGYLAEVSYNNLLFKNGSLRRNLTFWINVDALLEDAGTEAIKSLRQQSAAESLASIENAFISSGFTVSTDENFVEITLEKYDSYTDYYIHYGINGYDNSSSESVINKGAFFNEYSSKNFTVFNNYKDSYIELGVSELVKTDGIEIGDVAFIYNYGTKYSERYITSDADKIYKKKVLGDELTIHKFVMDANTFYREYTLTQKVPNTVVWYSISLALAIFAAVVFTVVALIESGKLKKKESETDNG